MKTSNIILSTLIGSITFIIVTGAIQLRLTGEKRSQYVEQVYADISLPEFKYLVIKESVNLTITPSDEVKLVIHNAAGQDKPQVSYHEKADTLFIDHIKFGPGDRTLFVTLKTPVNNVKWIGAENAAFTLSDFPAKLLSIALDHSRMRVYSQDSLKLGTLKITGVNNSNIDALQVQVDTLELHLDQSEARVLAKVNKLKGSMVNKSSLFAKEVIDIEFRKDSSSKLD